MSKSVAAAVPTRREPLPVPPYRPPSRAKWKLLWGAINFTLLGTAAYLIERFLRREAKGDKYTYWFYVLFTWRYLRFAIALIGWFLYRPAKIPENPRYRPEDVTVILPTIDPEGEDFAECIRTTCENGPHSIFVVTAGNRLETTQKAVQPYVEQFPHINFRVDVSPVASKRAQVALEIPHIQTAITIMLDDHVFWKKGFLPAILAPFEDPQVGIVGTNKKVRRLPNLPFMRRLWNLLGAIYLYRHNFEVRAANAIDGGAFVISARTCAMRTEIVKLQEYIDGYTNEMFFFGMFGPLNPDDDNYNTRFCVSKGWKVKFQYTRDAEIETTIGVVPPYRKKFFGQVQRWARTTWRSNPASLFTDGSVWAYQPVSVYTVYLTSFTNFAVLDFLLWWLFMQTPLYRTRVWGYFSERWQPVACLVLLSMFSKIVKSLGYWWRHPQDLFPFLLCQILWGYFHSWFKLWALLTFYDHAWTGRPNLTGPAGATTKDAASGSSGTTLGFAAYGGGTTPTDLDGNPLADALQGLITSTIQIRVQQQNTRQNYHDKILSNLRSLRTEFSHITTAQDGIQANQALLRLEVDGALEEFDNLLTTIQHTAESQTELRTRIKRLAARVRRLQASHEVASDLLNSAPSPVASGDSELGDRVDGIPLAGRGRRDPLLTGALSLLSTPKPDATPSRQNRYGQLPTEDILVQFNMASATELFKPLPTPSPEATATQVKQHEVALNRQRKLQEQFIDGIAAQVAGTPLEQRLKEVVERGRISTEGTTPRSRTEPKTPTRSPRNKGSGGGRSAGEGGSILTDKLESTTATT